MTRRDPRSIDDLVLSPEGAAARRRAIEAIVDGIPVDLPPLSPEPEPERTRRKANHDEFMGRAFRSAIPGSGRGRILSTPPEWVVDRWHDESEAVPFPFGEEPDPEIRDGMIGGASVTILPVARLDPECAWEARDVPPVVPETVRGEEPTGSTAVEVAAWLEGIGEPMTVADLVDLTGADRDEIVAALRDWRWAGRVAKQQTRDEPLWLWRRMPL